LIYRFKAAKTTRRAYQQYRNDSIFGVEFIFHSRSKICFSLRQIQCMICEIDLLKLDITETNFVEFEVSDFR